jgi:hypothetical protein
MYATTSATVMSSRRAKGAQVPASRSVSLRQAPLLPHVRAELRQRLFVDLVDPKIAEDRADVRPHGRVVDPRRELELGDVAGLKDRPVLGERFGWLSDWLRIGSGFTSFLREDVDRLAERAEELVRLRASPRHRRGRVHAGRRDNATTDRLGRVEGVSEVDVDMLAGSIFKVWAGSDFQVSQGWTRFRPRRFLTR